MKILHVYKDYYPVLGGIENHIKTVAEAQAAAGHQVTVLVCHPERCTAEEVLNGVRVVRVARLATVASTPLSLGFPGALRALAPDITHLHFPYPVGEISQWFAGRARPYVITYHAEVTRSLQRLVMLLYEPLLRHILSRAACVLVTSPNYASSSPYLRRMADRLEIAPLGVDADRFAPAHSPSAAHPPTLLFVGRLRHYKGVEDLLRAMVAMPAGVRLLLAGDGPMRSQWEALRDALGLRERVSFLGEVADDELPALYQSADAFVLPATTRAEAFGTVLLEAMACGLPCVTTEVGSGTSYVVEHGVTGYVVAPRAPQALATALQRLTSDPMLRARLGGAGRERVLQHFTVGQMIRRVEEAYRAALSPSAL